MSAPRVLLGRYEVSEAIGSAATTEVQTLSETIHCQGGNLAALDHSHGADVIHRNIEPANVIVTSVGAVKIVDFGTAGSHADPAEPWTQAQAFLGTPSYLSPEQARGEMADAGSDVYSAWCLLCELVTGRPPFVGDDPVPVAYRHVHEAPAPAGTNMRALDAVVAKPLTKNPQGRFRSAVEFKETLLAATRCGLHTHPAHSHTASTTRALPASQASAPAPPSPITDRTDHHQRRNTSWAPSASEKRTAPRSSSTTRTRARVNPWS